MLDDPKAVVRETAPLINVWGPQAARSYGVVTKDYKYIYWPYEAGDFEPTEELYHLAKDPHERKNLAKARQGRTKRLAKQLNKLLPE